MSHQQQPYDAAAEDKYDASATTPPLYADAKTLSKAESPTHVAYAPVGRTELHERLPPHVSFEGYERYDPDFQWSPEEERRALRKTDLKLMSIICLMFGALQLDRGNLSNALADNLLKDLKVTQNSYNIGTSIQLVFFLSMEFPSQIMASRVGFSKWLPFLMTCWGIVSCFQAFMHNQTGFYITRALIGAFEGGFIPASITFISNFYTSKELAIRLAVFWSTLNLARVVSALLAAGILQMRGVGGRPGWFWLFIIEGGWTILMAALAFFWVPLSVVRTKGGLWRKPWYTEREEKIMVNRVLRDDPAKGLDPIKNKLNFRDIRDGWRDPVLWFVLVLGLISYVPAAPVQAYLTYSLKQLGFSSFASNCLTIPSAVLQIITMLTLSYSSDRIGDRLWHCFFGAAWVLPCLIALQSLPDHGTSPWARFTLATLVAGYPYWHPILTSLISENAFSVKRRSVQITTYNVVVQIGSIIGSNVYFAKDAPFYHKGNWELISFSIASLIIFATTWFFIGRQNAKKERIWSAMTEQEKQEYQDDLPAREAEGPRRLDFRSTR